MKWYEVKLLGKSKSDGTYQAFWQKVQAYNDICAILEAKKEIILTVGFGKMALEVLSVKEV